MYAVRVATLAKQHAGAFHLNKNRMLLARRVLSAVDTMNKE